MKRGKRKGERWIQEELAGEFNADVRTIRRNLKKALVDNQKYDLEIEQLQATHISNLQRLARWRREAVDNVRMTEYGWIWLVI